MGRPGLGAAVGMVIAVTLAVGAHARAETVCRIGQQRWLAPPRAPVPRNVQLWVIGGPGELALDGPTSLRIGDERGEEGPWIAPQHGELAPGAYDLARMPGDARVDFRVDDRRDDTRPPPPDPRAVRIELAPDPFFAELREVTVISVAATLPLDTALVRLRWRDLGDRAEVYVPPGQQVAGPFRGGDLAPVPVDVELTAIDLAGNESVPVTALVLPIVTSHASRCDERPGLEPRTLGGDGWLATNGALLALVALFVLVAVALHRRLGRGPHAILFEPLSVELTERVLRHARARDWRAVVLLVAATIGGGYAGVWHQLGSGAAIGLLYLALRLGDVVVAQRALRIFLGRPTGGELHDASLVVRTTGAPAAVLVSRRELARMQRSVLPMAQVR